MIKGIHKGIGISGPMPQANDIMNRRKPKPKGGKKGGK